MPDLELRYLTLDTELRVEGDTPRIVGYAAVFNTFSEDLGGFREIIRPGCFQRCLAAGADIRALVDHVPSAILGRTKAGTLTVTEDGRGLRFECTPPNTQCGRDIVESMRRGDVTGCSFGLVVAKGGDTWRSEQGKTIRELREADVFDVSLATYPAYRAADATLRSLQIYNETLTAADGDALDLLKRQLQLADVA